MIYLGEGVYVEGAPMALTVILGQDYPKREVMLAPFVAVSIHIQPPPAINSISGCPVVGADGLSVAQCLPDLNVLTLTGSGFLQWQRTPLQLCVGTSRASLILQLQSTPAQWYSIVNDTVITITLDNYYRDLLAAHDFGAPPLPFSILESLAGWSSKQMSIQFDVLPPPTYSDISPTVFYGLPGLPGCVWGPNRTTIINCTAGYAGLQTRGHYFYQVVATVGGQPMTAMLRAQQDVKVMSLVTPLYNFQPGVLYDLVLSAAGGSISIPNYVSFSGLPAIVSAACRDPLLPIDIAVLGCEPGDTVTLNGPYLPPPTIAFTVTVYSLASKQNVTCSNPRYNSEYQLACDMLVAGLPAPGGWDIWSAVEQHIQRPCMLYLTHLIHCCCFRVPCPQVRAVGDWPQHHHSRPLRRMEQS